MKMTMIEFAMQVSKMRETQCAYLIQWSIARKTGRPKAYEYASELLAESKRLELQVDILTSEILLSV